MVMEKECNFWLKLIKESFHQSLECVPQKMPHHCQEEDNNNVDPILPFFANKRLFIAAATAMMFTLSILFGEFPLIRYTPENNKDVFRLLSISSSSAGSHHHHHHRFRFINQSNNTFEQGRGRQKRLLVCTMLTNDFYQYAAGAAKIAQSIKKSSKGGSNTALLLKQRFNTTMELGILEMKERPLPPNVWEALKVEYTHWQISHE